MRKRKISFWWLLTILVLSTQISCRRTGSSGDSGSTPSPSPTEQEAVNHVLDRYQQAIGGKAAIDKITSYKLKGTFDVAGLRGTIEGWRKEPNKTLSVIQFPRIGTLKKGFDGENRWVQTPAGIVTDSSPQAIAEMERDAEVYNVAKIRGLYDTMKLEAKARLNGRDMHVIEGKPAQGPAEKLFFDAENGLLVRWDLARRRPQRGTVFVKVYPEDYRDVTGVKVPFRIRFVFESFTFAVQLDEMQHNIPVDDAVFRRP